MDEDTEIYYREVYCYFFLYLNKNPKNVTKNENLNERAEETAIYIMVTENIVKQM